MRIGIDAHYLEGHRTGVGRYLYALLQEWSNFKLSDIEFFLYFKKEIPKDLKLSPRFKTKILRPVFGLQSNALFIHYLLPKAAGKDGVDILFCPGYVAPVFYSGRIALVLHDIIYQAKPELHSWNSTWDRILLKWVSKISAKKAKIIFTPSDFSKKEILREYEVDKNKVFNISLAADKSFRKISNKEKIKQFKNKYDIRDKFILFVGSIFKRRHLPELVKAFAKTAKKLSNYQLLIVGANNTREDLKGVVIKTNAKLNRRAVLWEKVSWRDLPVCYNAADLFVYLSDYEGFGLPVIEAMSCETPAITSKTSSLVEVAGDAAILIQDNKNIDEISKALYRGVADIKLRDKLVNNGLKQAQKFSWRKCAKETLDKIISKDL